LQVVEDYRARILAQDAATFADLVRRWSQVEAALQAQILDLALQIEEMQAAGQTVTRAKLMRLERYQQLLAQAQQQVEQYNRWAANAITGGQRTAAGLGVEGATAAIEAVYAEAGVFGTFGRLNFSAVEAMFGLAADGTPLYELLAASYPETVASLTETLSTAIASGYNPRKTAGLMADAMAGNLNRATLIARTEQIRAYRTATQMQYQASGVVSGYQRRAALSDRTCAACLALDGKVYQTDQLIDSHPACRCVMIPILSEYDSPTLPTGPDWFNQQNAATQQKILGAAKYKAWKDGRFAFEDVARVKDDKTWGPTIRTASLSELT